MLLVKNIVICVVVGLVLCVIYGVVIYIRDLQKCIVFLFNEFDKVLRRQWLDELISDEESSYEESLEEEDDDEKVFGRIMVMSVVSDDGFVGLIGDDMVIDQEQYMVIILWGIVRSKKWFY